MKKNEKVCIRQKRKRKENYVKPGKKKKKEIITFYGKEIKIGKGKKKNIKYVHSEEERKKIP